MEAIWATTTSAASTASGYEVEHQAEYPDDRCDRLFTANVARPIKKLLASVSNAVRVATNIGLAAYCAGHGYRPGRAGPVRTRVIALVIIAQAFEDACKEHSRHDPNHRQTSANTKRYGRTTDHILAPFKATEGAKTSSKEAEKSTKQKRPCDHHQKLIDGVLIDCSVSAI